MSVNEPTTTYIANWMIPVSDTFRPKQDCIVEVFISMRTIPASLSGVKNERNVNTCRLLSLLKGHQWLQVIAQRLKDIFISDEVKTYVRRNDSNRAFTRE